MAKLVALFSADCRKGIARVQSIHNDDDDDDDILSGCEVS